MFKKISLFILGFSFLLAPLVSFASEQQDIYFFWSKGCPHCAKEKIFLEKIEDSYKNITIHQLELSESEDNVRLLLGFGEKFKTSISGVPFTVVGDEYFTGYYNDEITGAEIERAIKALTYIKPVIPQKPSVVEPEIDEKQGKDNSEQLVVDLTEDNKINQKVQVPIIGEINLQSFSLPIITIVLGLLDGFNPCAMWALLFLISLLLGMKDRKRMWILGITFVIVSAFVYFLFMVAWLKLILFLGFIAIVRYVISFVALVGGFWNLRSYFKNKNGGCTVAGSEKKRKFFDLLKAVTQKRAFILALLGIITLAFSVNLVELICSAGLPAVYVQILALNDLQVWQYYAYISLYIFVFMIDDLFVFFIAMWTLQMTGITTKYSKFSKLIGGILMVVIGLILIFKHELLMLG